MSVTHQELQTALLLSIDARLKTANSPKEPEMTAKHKACLQLAAMMNKQTPDEVERHTALSASFAARSFNKQISNGDGHV
jgi:hypothetical protein